MKSTEGTESDVCYFEVDTYMFISLSPSGYMPDLDNLTRCLDSLHIWFCANGMALNPDKSEAILLGTRQRAHSYSSLATVNVASSQIPLADHIKILGVALDRLADGIDMVIHGSIFIDVTPRIFMWSAKGI